MYKKVIALFFSFLVLLSVCGMNISAESNFSSNTAYQAYSYDLKNQPSVITAPYVPEKEITGFDLDTVGFKQVNDICYDSGADNIVIADSGNNRIVVINGDYSLKRIVDSFDNNGKTDHFSNPSGLFVKNNSIYISDTGNSRILKFDSQTYQLQQIFSRPEIPLLESDYSFQPTRLAVDLADRLYVVCRGINDGFVHLDNDGEFLSFVGAPQVEYNAVDMLWRKFMTEEQIASMQQIVPTEYNSLEIDSKGFLYATTQTADVAPIVRLNSQGVDVLKSGEASPSGDAVYTDPDGEDVKSSLIDIAVREDGTYFALDNERGRIFAYSIDGELLYAFGSKGGQQLGTFESAFCIELMGRDILVSDYSSGRISVFKKTEFGSLIDEAIYYQQLGDYERSYEAWNEVTRQSPNYMLAYLFIARIDIQNGNYSNAITSLKMLRETEYYSIAFRYFRSEFIKNNFYLFVALIIALVLIVIFVPKLVHKTRIYKRWQDSKLYSELKYSKYVIFHPLDGFWDIKREKRGSAAAATVIFIEFILLYAIRSRFSGYLVSDRSADEINVLLEVIGIFLPIVFWIISNWCFTTLMDGEGNMKDIYIATAYSLKPYVMFSIPLLFISHIVSSEEMFIYTIFNAVVIIWTLGLIFFGMITTHDYGLGKGIISLILTLIGMCLMIFLLLVFFNLLQELLDTGISFYQEIAYRFY